MIKHLQRIGHFLPYVFFLVAAYVVHRQVTMHPMREIANSLADIPWQTIAIASAITAINYMMLSAYDWLGVTYAGLKVPYRRIMLASLISYAISNNAGHALVSGTSVRYRFYSASGVGGWDILKISGFSALTFMIAAFTMEAGLSLLVPDAMQQGQAAPKLVHTITLISAAALGFYWMAIFFLREPIRFKDYEFRMPSPRLATLQTVIGILDLVVASSILYIFLKDAVPMSFAAFLAIYTLALLAGLISQVPGGIGVFEGTFMWFAGTDSSSVEIMSALVMYRIIYYFLPLALAGVGMFLYELRHHGERLAKGTMLVSTALSQSIPVIFSLLLFCAGTVLIASGATPEITEHIEILKRYIPIAVVEVAHIGAILCGIALLFLARGIRLHLRSAWTASMLLLLAGAAGAIMRGLDWHEASILIFIFMLMLPIRRHLTREGSLLHISLSHEWAAMIAIVLAGSSWLGFFAYRHVEYSNELFWQFSFSAKGGAARFLRALAVSAAVLSLYILYRFITDARPRRIAPPTREDLAQARTVTAQSSDPRGYLALLEDKNILWSDDRQAFIMYAVTPNYWIAMSDPIGKRESFDALVWKFRETANMYYAQAVFYQVSDRFLPLYLDLGMVMVKIGENAVVKLSEFTLSGGKRENQRKGRNRFLKQGYALRMLDAPGLEAALPRLREISDRWLNQKMAREKGFSLGFFSEDYIRQTRVAIIEYNGQIEAFCNIWDLENKHSLAIDLMRYDPETAPINIMEFLTIELILWAQAEGYERFDLGMAPLSGLEKHPLAPLWHKIGNVIFEHGEDFYNFEGLYAYKSKFGPEWQPRYLAAPSGLRIPMVLMSVASVISGGLQGVFRK